MINIIKQKAIQYFPEVQAIRHHIHTYPELSFQEHNTSAFIVNQLNSWGITNLKIIAGTGIVALIEGKTLKKNALL